MYINVNDQVGVSINVTRIVEDKASFPGSRDHDPRTQFLFRVRQCGVYYILKNDPSQVMCKMLINDPTQIMRKLFINEKRSDNRVVDKIGVN